MFNLASLGLDIDAHAYFTAAIFGPGYSLMVLSWLVAAPQPCFMLTYWVQHPEEGQSNPPGCL